MHSLYCPVKISILSNSLCIPIFFLETSSTQLPFRFLKTIFYISNEVRARQKQLQLFLAVEPTDPERVKKAQPHQPFTESNFSDEVRLRQKQLFLAAEPTDHSCKQDYITVV